MPTKRRAARGVVDFAELLLRAYEIWKENPSLLEHYRTRFRHVLVDEFQDTNAIQYKWLTLLVGQTVCLSWWDDDQSIYRWRGARVENLHQFRRDYPQAQLVKLEQNYRSTGTILKAANASSRTTPDASARIFGPAAPTASGQAVRRIQRARRADFVVIAFANGWSAAARAAKSRCCTARTRNRGCSKRRS